MIDPPLTAEEIALAAPGRWRIGELLHNADLISAGQLESALAEQTGSSSRIGDTLIRMGTLNQRDRDVVLEFQEQLTDALPGEGKLRLGSILVTSGQITRAQLGDALQHQQSFGGRLGATLIAAGHATIKQVANALLVQQKLVAKALLAAISLAALVAASVPSAAAGQGGASLQVSVNVVANARARIDYQATQLTISAGDIARGYVEVAEASRFAVVTNSRAGYRIDFHPLADFFQAVRVSGADQSAQLGPDGGSVAQRGVSSMSHQLSYRFMLVSGLQPGTYAWPLQIAVRPI